MDRRYVNLILILVIVAATIWVDLPRAEGSSGLTIGSFHRTLNPVLGLDLRGGLQVLLAPQAGAIVDSQALADTSKILENRANGLGVSEVVFQVAGDKYILAEFPGLTNTDEVISSIKQTGLLEFIDAGSTQLAPGTVVVTDYGQTNNGSSEATATPSATATPEATVTPEASGTATPAEKVYHTVMTGAEIKSAIAEAGQTLGGFAVGFELNPEGAAIFNTYTTNNVGKFLAIVLDKKVISCPVIDSAIPDGKGQISGTFTSEEANNLAVTLRYGGLKVPVDVVESKVVGPTLGSDSLSKSLLAGIIGFAIVFLFMLIYYRLPGAMAVISISIYAGIVFALYKLLPVTLTLPGIAGFLLSTGGALDANILIFERMKEELHNGRTLRQAIELGWTRAWPSIRDSNIATLITSIILFWFGSAYGASIVKGFALTLMLGVVVSVFAAAFFTRTFLRLSADLINPASHEKWFGA
jgi:preprotein translocase subunit SecD